MRSLVLIAALALAANAFAGDKPKAKSQDGKADESSPALAPDEKPDASDSGTSRSAASNKGQQGDRASGGHRKGGTDYNSSRSNNESVAAPNDNGEPQVGDSRRHADGSMQRDGTNRAAADGDYNSSRSNNINGAADLDQDGRPDLACRDGVDDDCDGVDDEEPANHNTTRSNKR